MTGHIRPAAVLLAVTLQACAAVTPHPQLEVSRYGAQMMQAVDSAVTGVVSAFDAGLLTREEAVPIVAALLQIESGDFVVADIRAVYASELAAAPAAVEALMAAIDSALSLLELQLEVA